MYIGNRYNSHMYATVKGFITGTLVFLYTNYTKAYSVEYFSLSWGWKKLYFSLHKFCLADIWNKSKFPHPTVPSWTCYNKSETSSMINWVHMFVCVLSSFQNLAMFWFYFGIKALFGDSYCIEAFIKMKLPTVKHTKVNSDFS